MQPVIFFSEINRIIQDKAWLIMRAAKKPFIPTCGMKKTIINNLMVWEMRLVINTMPDFPMALRILETGAKTKINGHKMHRYFICSLTAGFLKMNSPKWEP